ncbi:MAG TPA: AprI/Inh family metalloprotease inhibitor, partial [Xanthobacteraceae bacterium]|nr:AprI/Inh family metalloprotease inhibitor [Xanthobacteraceae bacterium]
MRVDPHVVRTAILGLLAALGLLAGSPAAQAQSDAAKAMVGTWELSNADRDRTCTVNFKLGPSSASYPIELDGKCQQVFPAVRGIAGWTFGRNDNLLLVDAAGKQVLELLEV